MRPPRLRSGDEPFDLGERRAWRDAGMDDGTLAVMPAEADADVEVGMYSGRTRAGDADADADADAEAEFEAEAEAEFVFDAEAEAWPVLDVDGRTLECATWRTGDRSRGQTNMSSRAFFKSSRACVRAMIAADPGASLRGSMRCISTRALLRSLAGLFSAGARTVKLTPSRARSPIRADSGCRIPPRCKSMF